MRKLATLLPALLLPLSLAACNPAKSGNEAPADAAAPVTPVTSAPVAADPVPEVKPPIEPTAPAPLTPPAPGQPGGLPDDRTPISEGPIIKGSAQDAANVVQTYYALLEEGQYTQAWALWGDRGQQSGQTARAFADSFRQYSEYHANVGAPGRMDAGAGQRYVDVPVQVYGRFQAGGRQFNQRGAITLHRTGDVDGSTAEDRSWRIKASDVKPGGAETNAPTPPSMPMPPKPVPPKPPQSGPNIPDFVTAQYRCDGDIRLTVDFDNKAGTATVRGGGRKSRAVMKIQPVASGISYAGNGYSLRGKGDDATFTAPNAKPVACKSSR